MDQLVIANILESMGQLNYLQQLRSTSKESINAGHEAFREWYKGYKENFAKNLKFDPEEENLSIFFHFFHLL